VSAPVNAPDGLRWPAPIVAVSQEEQRPWTFGWHPYANRQADRSIVASDVPDDESITWQKHKTRFHLVSANLPTADYWLVGPDGPLDRFVGIERKENDFGSSFTADMPRFKEECERLRDFYHPAIVTSCTWEALKRKFPQHEAAFLGGAAMISSRFRIPIFPCADRRSAEAFAGWMLLEHWQAYLIANPVALAWAREEERRRGIVHEHKRAQRKAKTSAFLLSQEETAKRYPEQPPRPERAFEPGERDERRRAATRP
jgi:hypothetical protein